MGIRLSRSSWVEKELMYGDSSRVNIVGLKLRLVVVFGSRL